MEQKTRFNVENIPMDKLGKAGVAKDFISKMETQERNDFLNGYRSHKLYTINAKINNEDYKIPAKLRLYGDPDNIQVKVHPIQRLHIPDKYMGHTFTKDEKDTLIKERNLGKVLELKDQSGNKDKYFVGIDAKTNELIPMKQKHIRISDQIKGVSLSDQQKQDLMEGRKVKVDGMTGKNDKKFSAVLQVNPGGRNIGFSDFKQEKNQSEKKEEGQQKKTSKGAKVST